MTARVFAAMPRRFYAIDVGAGALVMTSYLWSWVSEAAKRSGGPHWIAHTREQVAHHVRGLSDRTITTYLRRLRGEDPRSPLKLIDTMSINGRHGFWLLTPTGFEDERQASDRSITEKLELLVARLKGDPGSFDPGSRGEILDHSIQDLRSSDGSTTGDPGSFGSPLHLSYPLTIAAAEATTSPEERSRSAAAAANDLLRSQARELLAELATPLSLLGFCLPPTPRTVELLASLLDVDDGSDADHNAVREYVYQTVCRFAEMCTRVPAQRRFLCADMFSEQVREGKSKSNWAAIEYTLHLDAAAQLAAQNEAARAAEAERVVQQERAREAAEREQLERHRMTYEQVAAGASHLIRGARLPAARGDSALGDAVVDEREQHRQLVAFRSSLERLGRTELQTVQRELGRAMAAAEREQDPTQIAAVRSRNMAVANRLAALEEAAHA